jgi:Mor family transcriptional regulator
MKVHTVALAQIVGAVADRLASQPSIPTENRMAYRDTIVSVFSAQLSAMFGGEEVRFYVPKVATDLRRARDERIAAALEAGESAETVAKRERLSERRVRQVRGRFGGGNFPP